MKIRLEPEHRFDVILTAAIELATKGTLYSISLRNVADAVKSRGVSCSPSTVKRYFGGMKKLRIEIIKTAIDSEILPIIAQAVIAKDPAIVVCPMELQMRALAGVLDG